MRFTEIVRREFFSLLQFSYTPLGLHENRIAGICGDSIAARNRVVRIWLGCFAGLFTPAYHVVSRLRGDRGDTND